MGNGICRIILAADISLDLPAQFADSLRSEVHRPTSLYCRNLHGKSVRKPHLLAARDAGLCLIDVDPVIDPALLARVAAATFGENRFVVRTADDEGLDITWPSADVLARLYPGIDLAWALEPDETPIPWNTDPFYLFPGNPPHWSLKVPVMASLLRVVNSLQRPCPMCQTVYSSKGERGQCPSCGFVAWPFRSAREATEIVSVPLDAYAWGRCPRCRGTHEFIHQVEQCFQCGKLLEGFSTRHHLTLVPNKNEIVSLVGSLGWQ
jgi:hypothetical protein